MRYQAGSEQALQLIPPFIYPLQKLTAVEPLNAWGASGTANNSAWTYISGSYTLTVNGTLTGLFVYVEGPATGIDIYLDDVSVFGAACSSATARAKKH